MSEPESAPSRIPNDTRPRLVGGAIGLAFGFAAYWLALQRGVDIVIAVPAGLSLGVARGSRRRNARWAVSTAIAAPIAALLSLWWFRPFGADRSLLYFVANVTELPQQALLSLGAAVLVGAWFGIGRNRR